MYNYRIANIDIQINGEVGLYLKNRLRAYEDSLTSHVVNHEVGYNVEVDYSSVNTITLPGGMYFDKDIRTWQWILKSDGSYAAYQRHPFTGEVVSLFEADKSWSKVALSLKHFENQFDTTTDTRSVKAIGEIFRHVLLKRDSLSLHSSAIAYNGEAVLFSAESGTGKSTHTSLWRKYYDAAVINDDLPAVRPVGDGFYAFGTPWSGKTTLNSNISAPIKAIVFLDRAERPSIRRLRGGEAFARLISEISRPVFNEMTDDTMSVADRLLRAVPTYLLSCDISKEAVDVVRKAIFLNE